MNRVGLTAVLLVLAVLTTSCETTPERNLPALMQNSSAAYPRVVRLDKTGRVAMIDAGAREGLVLGERLYTMRDGQPTGLLKTNHVFDQASICYAVSLTRSGNIQLRVGDVITTSYRGAYLRSSYRDALLKERVSTLEDAAFPTEEELQSLEERIAEIREQGALSEEVVKPAVEGRKEIEQAWKEAVQRVQPDNSIPLP